MVKNVGKGTIAGLLCALTVVMPCAGAQAEDNDCERPFTLNEVAAIAPSYTGSVNLPQCKRQLDGRLIDTTDLAAAEIMGMLGIYTVACGRPAGVTDIAQMISHIISEAVSDGGNMNTTSLREVVAVRVYECGANDR